MGKNYIANDCITGVQGQHNIMVFIGNGFDIAVLKEYRKDGRVSSYDQFYEYLCANKEFSMDNVLFKRMTKDKQENKKNWSDFESSIVEIIKDGTDTHKLDADLKEMQNMFLLFLNEIVDTDILLEINHDAEEQKWSSHAISSFLGDLNESYYKRMMFPKKTGHYDMYNYLFVNFNYTSIFDNYIYLDRKQFDPHIHKTVDTNFRFYPNPQSYHVFEDRPFNNETKWSSYIMTETIHPHGYQSIPRSLLFGIEEECYAADNDLKKFNKSYWAQNDQKYKTYFDTTELFIIYGASIGKTDGWWWRNIYNSLSNTESELIIYYYDESGERNEEEIKNIFIEACGFEEHEYKDMLILDKIYVVLYNDKSRLKMFSLKR